MCFNTSLQINNLQTRVKEYNVILDKNKSKIFSQRKYDRFYIFNITSENNHNTEVSKFIFFIVSLAIICSLSKSNFRLWLQKLLKRKKIINKHNMPWGIYLIANSDSTFPNESSKSYLIFNQLLTVRSDHVTIAHLKAKLNQIFKL